MHAQTTVSAVIPFGAAETWAAISDFGDYRWGEGVGPAEIEGACVNEPGSIRRFAYYGHPSEQRLTAFDDDARTMTWESVAPFDATLSHYAATITVRAVTATGQSFVEWGVIIDASAEHVEQWSAHQRREFRKSLERLAVYVGWSVRGDLD